MKNINIAICAAIFSFIGVNKAYSIDLDKLTTNSGEVYHQISVISSDHNGLLFRHSAGAGKVSFTDLSPNIRELFQPPSKGSSGKGLPTDKGGSHRRATKASGGIEQDYVVTVIVRRPVQQQAAHFQAIPQVWPANVHPVHQVHLLHNPYFRAQANLNFLRFNGLLPGQFGHRRNFVSHRFNRF